MDEKRLKLKESLWGSVIVLSWDEIASIAYESYRLDFQLCSGKTVGFNYTTNSDTSKEVKNLIREVAERKNIAISGG